MKRPRVLVTAVGGDVGLDLARCLLESHRPVDVLGCDMARRTAAGSTLANVLVSPPASDEAAYVDFLLKQGVDAVWPSSEAEIIVLDRHRKSFASAGVRLVMVASPLVRVFTDKLETARALRAKGLPAPVTFDEPQFKGQLPFPLILKPRHSSGSRQVVLARDETDLSFHRARMPGAVVQEALGSPDEEYTGGVFSDGKETRCILFKRRLGFGGVSREVELVDSPEFARLAADFARAFSLRGGVNLQARKTAAGFSIFEVNARVSSTAMFRHRLGFEDVAWWLDLEFGRDIPAYTPRFSKAVGLRTLSNQFVELHALQTGPMLSCERFTLRPLTPDDVTADYVDGLNDPEVNRYLVEVRKTRQTVESVRAFVTRDLLAADTWLFGIFPSGLTRPIGTVRLHAVDRYNFTAILGVCLFSRAHWGKGYGSEAVARVSRFAFEELGLHYLEACTYEENAGSTKLFLKAGFDQVGVVADKYRYDGAFTSVIALARTNPLFDKSRLEPTS